MTEWTTEAIELRRHGKPQIITPRLGRASFRLAVLDAYDGARAVTYEHSLAVLEAAHIRPWKDGGRHEVSNGLPLRRDIHRLFDLGFGPSGRTCASRSVPHRATLRQRDSKRFVLTVLADAAAVHSRTLAATALPTVQRAAMRLFSQCSAVSLVVCSLST